MRWRDAMVPVPMTRVAVVAPTVALRAALVRVAAAGTMEIDQLVPPADVAAGEASRSLQRLGRPGTVSPRLAPTTRGAATGIADPASVTVVVPHGAPSTLRLPADPADLGPAVTRALVDLDGPAHVVSTFGLIGPGKGIHDGVAALPEILARPPDVRYMIAGATFGTGWLDHPLRNELGRPIDRGKDS